MGTIVNMGGGQTFRKSLTIFTNYAIISHILSKRSVSLYFFFLPCKVFRFGPTDFWVKTKGLCNRVETKVKVK